MLEVADILRLYGEEYLQKFGDNMLPSQRSAFADILKCRTQVMGGHVFQCDKCGHRHYSYHSYCNRSCPKCHGDDTAEWLEQRRKELLGVELPSSALHKDWVVYCKPTIQGIDKVLNYLGRYVHRVAITNSRILSIDNGKVTFRYKDRKSHKWKKDEAPGT